MHIDTLSFSGAVEYPYGHIHEDGIVGLTYVFHGAQTSQPYFCPLQEATSTLFDLSQPLPALDGHRDQIDAFSWPTGTRADRRGVFEATGFRTDVGLRPKNAGWSLRGICCASLQSRRVENFSIEMYPPNDLVGLVCSNRRSICC